MVVDTSGSNQYDPIYAPASPRSGPAPVVIHCIGVCPSSCLSLCMRHSPRRGVSFLVSACRPQRLDGPVGEKLEPGGDKSNPTAMARWSGRILPTSPVSIRLAFPLLVSPKRCTVGVRTIPGPRLAVLMAAGEMTMTEGGRRDRLCTAHNR